MSVPVFLTDGSEPLLGLPVYLVGDSEGGEVSATVILRQTVAKTVVFDGSDTSNGVDMAGYAGGAIYLPSGFTGTELTFQMLVGAAYYDVHEGGSLLTLTVSNPASNILPASLFGLGTVKFVSDQTETCNGTLQLSS